MSTHLPPNSPPIGSSLDVLDTITCYSIDDVVELLGSTARSVNSSGAGLYLSGQRDRSPFFGRLASRMSELSRALFAWRSGNPPPNYDLVLALEECLFAIEALNIEFQTHESRLVVPHQVVTRMLLQLKPRDHQTPLAGAADAR